MRVPFIAARGLILACALGILSGCTASDALRDDPITSARINGGTATRSLTVAIVTDRQTGTSEQLGFDNHWGEEVRCATAAVTVPAPSIPSGSVAPIVAELPVRGQCTNKQPFDGFASLVTATEAPGSCNSVLLYVHGYNTTFRSALLRAGQIAADAEWPCAMAALSWGSEGKFDRYAADIERSGYAVPVLMQALQALQRSNTQINIIAHSMGSRVTLSALSALSETCAKPILNELILAAPDVSSEEYNDDFGTLLKRALPCVRRVTVYASRNDVVLMLSESIHGGIPRAGLEPESDLSYTANRDNVEIVDATDAPGDPFGHGYFISSYEMLDDIMMVLRGVDIAHRASVPGASTLICANEKHKACTGPQDRYALAVSSLRKPDWAARLERHALAHLLAIQYGVPGQLTP